MGCFYSVSILKLRWFANIFNHHLHQPNCIHSPEMFAFMYDCLLSKVRTTLFQSNPLHLSTCNTYVNLNFVINSLTQPTTKSFTSNLLQNVNGIIYGFYVYVLNANYKGDNPLKEIELSRLRYNRPILKVGNL